MNIYIVLQCAWRWEPRFYHRILFRNLCNFCGLITSLPSITPSHFMAHFAITSFHFSLWNGYSLRPRTASQAADAKKGGSCDMPAMQLLFSRFNCPLSGYGKEGPSHQAEGVPHLTDLNLKAVFFKVGDVSFWWPNRQRNVRMNLEEVSCLGNFLHSC